MSTLDISKLKTDLSNDNKMTINNNSTNKKTKITETVKTYAIGAVIDNVRDSFSIINEEEN